MGSDVREEIRRNHLRTVELVDLVIDLTPKWRALRRTPADVQKNLAQLGIWAQQIRTQRLRVIATWNDELEKQYAAVGTPITTPFREYVPEKPGFVVREHPFIVVNSAHELVVDLCLEPDPPRIQAGENLGGGRLVMEPPPKGAILGETSSFFGGCSIVKVAEMRSALEEEFRKVMVDLGSTAEEPSVEGDRQAALQRRFHELVERARAQCDAVVVSIFVNPLQFGPQEDYDSYPRTLTADCALLEPLQVDWLFAPNVAEMYPQGQGAGVIRVGTPAIADILCGANRPGHFSGVTTVVSKLFNIVQPDRAYFGEKDYQQLAIIRALVRDLDFPITITGVPTRREADGLAMSSRNGRLSSDDRQRAPLLYRALCETADRLRAGDRNLDQLCAQARDTLTAAGFAVDYFTVLAADDLSPAD